MPYAFFSMLLLGFGFGGGFFGGGGGVDSRPIC